MSGGSSSRFDSIFAALDELRPDLFVVSDLSRWTRDRPSRYWAIKAILEDRHVRLVSVDEPWLDSDIPFSATVTTATVEKNFLERESIRKKTSAGVRRAYAAGKIMRPPWGWQRIGTAVPAEWAYDAELITGLFQDYADAHMSLLQIGLKYGIRPSNIPAHIRSRAQRRVVGDELWERANERVRLGVRVQRRDARQSSIYRRLLVCPWCGGYQHQTATWGGYQCGGVQRALHGWVYISAPRYVTPRVRAILDSMVVPESEDEALAQEEVTPAVAQAPDIQKRLDRLAEVYVLGHLDPDKYLLMREELEGLLLAPPPCRPVLERISIVNGLREVDLDEKDPEIGALVNRLIRELLEPIRFEEDRTPIIRVRSEYSSWLLNS